MRLKLCLIAACVAALTLGAVADEKAKTGHGHSSTASAQPEMTPEQKAMMDAWMKSMTPNEHHKMLDGMVGTFDAKVMMWEMPNTDPQVTSGTSKSWWVMGGRYVETKFDGSMMGMPFEGRGFTGYDNNKKEYWSTWMDNTSTGIMTATGNVSDDGKTWTWTSSMVDPMGKNVPMTQKITVKDKDHHSWELWMPAPDGTMYKGMQIDYTRKKS